MHSRWNHGPPDEVTRQATARHMSSATVLPLGLGRRLLSGRFPRQVVGHPLDSRPRRRRLCPGGDKPYAACPKNSSGKCGAVLRRWDLNRILTRAQIDQALDALMGWPLRVTQMRGLFADAWRLRANVTFADAVYVALAAHLGADLLSDDGRLANGPGLPVRVLHLPG
jgi:predicted nucleic acid-binding protein